MKKMKMKVKKEVEVFCVAPNPFPDRETGKMVDMKLVDFIYEGRSYWVNTTKEMKVGKQVLEIEFIIEKVKIK